MIINLKSERDPGVDEDEKVDNIYLFLQYYIDKVEERDNENKRCLKENINNKYITKIYLLNEKIYTKEEMGLNDEDMKKIHQVEINERLMFSHIFNYIKNNEIKGYYIISNADIYYNDTLKNVYKTSIMNKRVCYAQLRDDSNNNCKLEKNCVYSQDTWILHTNNIIENISVYNIKLGIPGCDNKIIFLLNKNGNFKLYNKPLYIKCIHLHKNDIRPWRKNKFSYKKPWLYLQPNNYKI